MKIESLNRRIWGRLRDGHFLAKRLYSHLHLRAGASVLMHSSFILFRAILLLVRKE